VLDQVGQHVEHLRLDPHDLPGATQLMSVDVEFIATKRVDHPGPLA
jgi:hypothetical protein